MIYWYRNLYMDETVKKHQERCKRRVMRRRPWKRNYYALMLASNEKNLFEIIGTRQLFFRRFACLDMYVIGLAANYKNALKLLQGIVEKAYRDGRESSGEDRVVFLRDYFDKRDFAGGDGK